MPLPILASPPILAAHTHSISATWSGPSTSMMAKCERLMMPQSSLMASCSAFDTRQKWRLSHSLSRTGTRLPYFSRRCSLARCREAAQKVYNPAVHPREPYATGRNVRRSPFYEREKELGGYFMELGGWERAHGYAANEPLLEKYGSRVPVRENEWDGRHFWRVSNAEQLAMSEDCGIVNLSHFYMFDVEGPDHVG